MSIGSRIKRARIRQGFSQRALAEQAGISAMAISKFERDLTAPASDTLIRVSQALGLGLDYFLRPSRVGNVEPAYRKESRFGKREQAQLVEKIRDWLERYLEAEALSPTGERASFALPDGFPRRVETFEEVEAAAVALRKAWEIGLDPMEDLTGHLEDKGIRVGLTDAADGFDACAFEAAVNGGMPVIVTREGLPGDRQRFNLAHELGHLMLEVIEDPDARFTEERACHRFAGAFLAPASTFLADIGEHRNSLNLIELHLLKHKYGLSMQALIHRAYDLGVISKTYTSALYEVFRERGWREEEPGEQVPAERPTRFRRLVQQALAEAIISRKRAAELYKAPLETPEEKVFSRDLLELSS